MRRFILVLSALLLSIALYGNNYSAELAKIDTLIAQRMNRDAIELARELYNSAASSGDRLPQMQALKRGVTTELSLDYSAKDQLLDSLIAMKRCFQGDELSCALLNSIAYDLTMFMISDARVKQIRNNIVEETLQQREVLSAIDGEPYSQFIALENDNDVASTTLYIALLRRYVSMPYFQSSFLTKKIYEELISLPEMSDELQVVVQFGYAKFMREDITAKLKELERRYSHCDAVVVVSAYLIEQEIRDERYEEEQDYERFDKMCRAIKAKHRKSKHLHLIDNIIADLQRASGTITLPKQLYPNIEREVEVEVRNVEQITVELYRLSGEVTQSESIPGIEIYNKNRREKIDSLVKQSSLVYTHKQSFKPRLHQQLKDVVPLKVKEYGRYLAVVRDAEGRVLSGEMTSVSKIGATTALTNDKLIAYVVDFNSGAPIKRASFDLYMGDEYLFTRKLESEDGRYEIANRRDLKSNTYYTVKVDDGAGDILSIANVQYNRSVDRSTNDRYTITCYTDRGAYHPGDTVHVHSVLYSPSKELIEGLHICNRVDFASGKILTYDHTKTDRWGGASSSLVIPKDAQSGRYRIYAFSNSRDGNNIQRAKAGQKYIRVESYTQPTSEIELKLVKPVYFSSERVQLRGRVTGYDGRNMEGVEVHYEVGRRVSYSYDEREMIEQKSVKTNSLGEYEIGFVASAAPFSGYNITARMVDKNGETREVEQSLYVEDTPYWLELTSPYKIPRSQNAPFTFRRSIPRDEPLVWNYTISKVKDDEPIFSGEFNDDETLEIPYDKLEDGVYQIKWSSPQGVGDDGYRRFFIYDDSPSETAVNDDVLFVDAPQERVVAGDPLRYTVSTAEREIYAYVTLVRGDSLIHSEVKRISRGVHQYSIDYPATSSHDVDLAISTVKGGVHYDEQVKFNIVKSDETIEVVIEDLKSELTASTANTLRVRVRGKESKQGVQSKLIVTIYDKASDQIQENKFSALESKESSWAYFSRSFEPFASRYLHFDFSRGESYVNVRGMADFSEDQPCLVPSENSNSQGEIQTKVRDNFSGTALFSGEIITGEGGDAVIPFTLSDLLTTYCVKVVAVTDDARSATAKSEFVATKKVMVSTLLPQFIRVGDLLRFKTMAINRRDHPVSAAIKLEIFDARTKTIFNNAVRQLTLATNSSQSIEWEVVAPDGVEQLGVQVALESTNDNDIEQHTLRVDRAVERVKIGQIEYLDGTAPVKYIKPHALLQEGAFNESMTHSYEAILPAMIRAVVAQREAEPTTAIDFANRAFTTQAMHRLAMRYKLSTLTLLKSQEDAKYPEDERWFGDLIGMRDHTKPHKESWLNLYRLEEFRCGDGGYSWLRGGESSLMVSLYVARMQLGEMGVKCANYSDKDLRKSLVQTLEYLDKRMAKSSDALNRDMLEYLELRSRSAQYLALPIPEWSSYLDMLEREWRSLNTYQMAQVALVLGRSDRDNSEVVKLIKQQAVTCPETGVTFPSGYADNFATIVEGNIAAHALIMTLLRSTGEDDEMVREMFKWLMLQRKNQVWVNSATTLEVVGVMYDVLTSKIFNEQNKCQFKYPQNMVRRRLFTTADLDIDVVRGGGAIGMRSVPNAFVDNKAPAFSMLDYSYDVALEDIGANSSGFSITRELLSGDNPQIGDIVRVRYTIKSDRNINLVKLRTIKCGAYEPRDLSSGYRNGYYREVRSDCVNYYFDLIERGTTTIEEEFLVWYGGSFADGYAVIESVMNPHLSGNTAIDRVEIE